MLTKFEENEARALVYQDGVSPQIAVKMRFITQKKSLNIKDLSLLWLPNLYNVRTIDMTPFLERRAEIVAMQEPLRIVRKALAA